MTNRYGGMSGRCIKPICLRVVSELREGGIRLPIIATGGIRTFDDAPRVLLGRRGRGQPRLGGLPRAAGPATSPRR